MSVPQLDEGSAVARDSESAPVLVPQWDQTMVSGWESVLGRMLEHELALHWEQASVQLSECCLAQEMDQEMEQE